MFKVIDETIRNGLTLFTVVVKQRVTSVSSRWKRERRFNIEKWL